MEVELSALKAAGAAGVSQQQQSPSVTPPRPWTNSPRRDAVAQHDASEAVGTQQRASKQYRLFRAGLQPAWYAQLACTFLVGGYENTQ